MPIARLPEATSILDYGSSTEGPVGVPASDDTTESSVFHVQEPTTSAPSAYVAGPAKVERGLNSSVGSNPTVSALEILVRVLVS